jgi:hypothetical protein
MKAVACRRPAWARPQQAFGIYAGAGLRSRWDPAGLFGQAVRVKSRRARWLDRVRSRGWPPFRAYGDRFSEADTLVHLGDTYDVLGDQQAARRAWQEALSKLIELHHQDASRIRAKLSKLGDRERASGLPALTDQTA